MFPFHSVQITFRREVGKQVINNFTSIIELNHVKKSYKRSIHVCNTYAFEQNSFSVNDW